MDSNYREKRPSTYPGAISSSSHSPVSSHQDDSGRRRSSGRTRSSTLVNSLQYVAAVTGIETSFDDGNNPYRVCLGEEDDLDDEPLRPRRLIVEDSESTREVSLLMIGEDVATGPCSFVVSSWFQLLAGGVIILNVVVLAQEHIHAELEHNYVYWLLNQYMLGFYVLEVVAKLGHFGGLRFFIDPVERNWNWMDFCIVISGVIEQWLMPLVNVDLPSSSDAMVQGSRAIRILRILRIFRLLRIMKLARVLKDADFSWTESAWFQSLVGFIIVSNAVVMGLETDIKLGLWWWVEQFFLVFYLFELIVRLKRQGWGFIHDEDERGWNFFDVLIIASSVADQWMLPLLFPSLFQEGGSHGKPKIGQIMNVMRLVRLLRILRLVRLIRTIRPLFVLAQGIIRAMQSMFWVLVLTIVGLYAFAIITTRMIGHAMMVGDPDDLPEISRRMFQTVPDSMFALFGIMNGQNWSPIMPLLDMIPWTKSVFVVFTIYASWALLSVMTGVVSDNMLSAREVDAGLQDELAQERQQLAVLEALEEIYTLSCEGGKKSAGMTRAAYRKVVSDPKNMKRVTKLSTVSPAELLRMFDMIDLDHNGKIEYEEFIAGFNWLNEPVTGKSLLKMECEFRQRVKQTENSVEKHVERINKQLDYVTAQNLDRFKEIADYLEEKTGRPRPTHS